MICIRPRNPRANGAAENKVKIIKAILQRMKLEYNFDDPQRDAWAQMLPTAQRAYNEGHSRVRLEASRVARAHWR